MLPSSRFVGGASCLFGLYVCFVVPAAPPPAVGLPELVQFLDRDQDGNVSPYEGAEAWLLLARDADQNGDGAVALRELRQALQAAAAERAEDVADMMADMDGNGDGVLLVAEVPKPFAALAKLADENCDGKLAKRELLAVREGDLLAAEAAAVFAEMDGDGDGKVTRKELGGDMPAEQFGSLDRDGDGSLNLAELEREFVPEQATFAVQGQRCIMNGVIGASTPGRMLQLVLEHPEVRTIEMHDVPGSMDDEANLRAARLVRRFGLATHLPKDAVIASGGVDFYLAGRQRTLVTGAKLGVHSWGGPVPGNKVPKSDPQHRLYLDFYREMQIPAGFYWYTLAAAPADDIHLMTGAEIEKYRVLTK